MAVTRIPDYDHWVEGAQGATVNVYKAGTTTLALIYSDEALTVALANPQTLLDSEVNGIRSGKWAQNVYVNEAVEIETVNRDQSAIIRPPLTTLVGEVADDATVKPTGGDTDTALKTALANVSIHVENFFGPLSLNNSASNTTKIGNAVGIAGAAGGGFVVVPAGTWPFTTLNLPKGVILIGQGVDATELQSQTAGDVITLSGDRCGLSRMTLNGVDRQAGSNGIFSKANDELRFQEVLIKSFDTGMHFKGARSCEWGNLSLNACNTGAKLHGDVDAGGGADGDIFAYNRWQGGVVSENLTTGVELSYEDRSCFHNALKGLSFTDNVDVAVKINGARYTGLAECEWGGNTTDLDVNDDDDSTVTDNTVIGLHVRNSRIDTGIILMQGTCQDVLFELTQLTGAITITLTSVTNNVLCRDCTEESVTLGGNDAVRWTRIRSILSGASAGLTTDATATKAWSLEMAPGQVVLATAKVIANGRNNIERAIYHIEVGAVRPGSTLSYDAQAVNYTVGGTLTGATSGATALITADADAGATGDLTLREIVGEFENNEIITDDSGGSATANGTLVGQSVILDTVGVVSHRTAYETDANYACTFVANGTELEVQVTGVAADVSEWQVFVTVESS